MKHELIMVDGKKPRPGWRTTGGSVCHLSHHPELDHGRTGRRLGG